MGTVALEVAGQIVLGIDDWPQSCSGSLLYPALLTCGECDAMIGRGEVAYAVKGDDARVVYSSLSCAEQNGYGVRRA